MKLASVYPTTRDEMLTAKYEWKFADILRSSSVEALQCMALWEFARESQVIREIFANLGDTVYSIQKRATQKSAVPQSIESVLSNLIVTNGYSGLATGDQLVDTEERENFIQNFRKAIDILGIEGTQLLFNSSFPAFSWSQVFETNPNIGFGRNEVHKIPDGLFIYLKRVRFANACRAISIDLSDDATQFYNFLHQNGRPHSLEVALFLLDSSKTAEKDLPALICGSQISKAPTEGLGVEMLHGVLVYHSISIEPHRVQFPLDKFSEDSSLVVLPKKIRDFGAVYRALTGCLSPDQSSPTPVRFWKIDKLRQILKDLAAYRALNSGLSFEDLGLPADGDVKRKWKSAYSNKQVWFEAASRVPEHFAKIFPVLEERIFRPQKKLMLK